MADGRHLKKNVKSPYLRNRLTDFDEIWHSDADWPPTGDISLKFRIFKKPKWRRPPSWKTTKLTISQQRIGRSLRNLARLCKMGLLTVQTVKNLNFPNPRWRTAAILKTVKLPYLCNRLTDFDEIWHGDGDWPPTGDRPLKCRIFQKPRWRRLPSWKPQKSRYHNNGLADLRNLARIRKMGLLTVQTVKKFEFPKSKMADSRHFEKQLNRHISASVWPILMKFGMMTQIGPLRGTDR